MYSRIDWSNGEVTHVFTLWLWTLVIGWIGNCKTRVFQICPTDRGVTFAYRDANRLETDVHIGWPLSDCWWNCEWIAVHWGNGPTEEEYQRSGVEFRQYEGVLGRHQWL